MFFPSNILMFFSCKNVIMKAIILKSELFVDTSFIFLLANRGRNSIYSVASCTGLPAFNQSDLSASHT